MTPEERREHCRRIARSGGVATLEKHGVEHMRQIGKKGFQALLEKGTYSDAGHLVSHLQELGKMPKKGS